MTLISEKNFDVVIVGAGPAGCAAAIRLCKEGMKVLLVEQKKFPREKLCGEFISPECFTHFEELGVFNEMSQAGGTELRETVFYARNGRCVSIQNEWFKTGSFALGLSRAEMDARLLKRARDVGAEVLEETQASGLLFDKEKVCGVQLKNERGEEFSAETKLAIDATGRARSLSRHATKEKRTRAKFVAFKTHLSGARIAQEHSEIYVYRGGYGGCNRVENNLYNVCFIASSEDTKKCGSDAERVMREIVFANKRAAESLREARIAGDWHAVSIESFGRGSLVPAEGLLTIGDAAAFIDPFTGSGILLALESAKIAANAITKNCKESGNFKTLSHEYQKQYSEAFDSRLRFCSLLRRAAFVPFMAEAVIIVLSLSNILRRRLAKATRQTETIGAK